MDAEKTNAVQVHRAQQADLEIGCVRVGPTILQKEMNVITVKIRDRLALVLLLEVVGDRGTGFVADVIERIFLQSTCVVAGGQPPSLPFLPHSVAAEKIKYI